MLGLRRTGGTRNLSRPQESGLRAQGWSRDQEGGIRLQESTLSVESTKPLRACTPCSTRCSCKESQCRESGGRRIEINFRFQLPTPNGFVADLRVPHCCGSRRTGRSTCRGRSTERSRGGRTCHRGTGPRTQFLITAWGVVLEQRGGSMRARGTTFAAGVVIVAIDPRAQRPARLPVVLSRDEVARLLSHLRGPVRLMASLMYGAGLRLFGMRRIAREGSERRSRGTHCSRWQGREGPSHDAPGGPEATVDGASVARQSAARR